MITIMIILFVLFNICLLGLTSNKILNLIINFFTFKNVLKIETLSLKCFFNELSKLEVLNEFVYKCLIDVCKEQNVYLFEVNDNVINKNRDENNKAAGMYIYLKGETVIEMNNRTNRIFKLSNALNKSIEIDDFYPRILINIEHSIKQYNNKYDLFTLAHELGHHFINIRGEEQSEDLANKYIYDIFLVYLPDFFIGVHNIMLKLTSKFKYDLDIDFKEMYKKYLIFRDEHPEMNLPICEI